MKITEFNRNQCLSKKDLMACYQVNANTITSWENQEKIPKGFMIGREKFWRKKDFPALSKNS